MLRIKGGRWLFPHLLYDLSSTSLVLLVVEEGVWRDVEEVWVGDVVSEFFEWAFLWGDVDPHGGGLVAGEPDGSTVVEEVRASALFESLGGGRGGPCV